MDNIENFKDKIEALKRKFDETLKKEKELFLKEEGGIPKKVLYLGECYASKEPMILETILGSCIATCIYDPVNKIGGMNHFLMPGAFLDNNLEDLMEKKDCRYGIFAIERLIQELIKLGAKKENLKAKIFGASYMGALQKKESHIKIQEKNMAFAESYLKMAKIPIIQRYIGKEYALKVRFRTDTGETTVKDIITK